MNKFLQYTMEGPAGCEVILDGKPYLYFAGTSYYQLHSHPELIHAAREALDSYGIGTATTRSMTGTTPPVKELESKLSVFFDQEMALYLPSGYLSSLAGIKALLALQEPSCILVDEHAHYSLQEAALATGLEVRLFRHRDAGDLEAQLRSLEGSKQRPLVATDGIFPLDGQSAPLDAYLPLLEQYAARIWIDDAHASGVIGESGRGSCEAYGLAEHELVYRGSTLSKAFGAYGGFLTGPQEFIEAARRGSVLTGSSAPMSAAIASATAGLSILETEQERRPRLWARAVYLKKGLENLGLKLYPNRAPEGQGEVPLAAFELESFDQMKGVRDRLLDKGIFIQHTGYQGSGSKGLLRIVISSEHRTEQIDRLTGALAEVL